MVQPRSTQIHRVEEGESLVGIAVKHGCTAGELRTLNKLHSSQVLSGQILFVPDEESKLKERERDMMEGSVGDLRSAPASSSSSLNCVDESGSSVTEEKSGRHQSSAILHRIPAMYITDGQVSFVPVVKYFS